MRNILLTVLAMCIIAASGCSAKFSSLEPEDGGRKTAYIATKKELMEEAEIGMIRAFPGRNLTRIDGEKAFGFSTWTRVALDTFTQQIIFFAVKGTNETDEEVDAFAFEVTGSGTSTTGYMRNKSFASDMKAALDAKFPTVTVK